MNVKPFTVEAWKLFRRENNELHGLYKKDFIYSVDTTLKAADNPNPWNESYPKSFHCYRNREQARKARKKFGLDNLVIRKVLLSGQIFTGDFYGYEGGYAATEMRVLEDKQ